jgi:hypothetical protein
LKQISFNSKVNFFRDFPDYSTNHVFPIYIQPILKLNKNPKDFVFGSFFTESPKDLPTSPLLFSYSYHVSQEEAFNQEEFSVTFKDISIIGNPGVYSIGMIVLKDEQCFHISSKTKINHHSLTESIYYGPHVYFGIPLLIIGVSLSCSLFLFFKKKIKPPIQLLKEKENQVNHFLDIERKFDVKNPWKHRLKEIFLSIFIDNNDLVRNCGTDSYYYTWFNKYLIIYSFFCGLISLIFLLPIYSNSNDFKMYSDFASTTIASINFTVSNYSLNHLLFTIFFLFLGIFFLRKLKSLSKVVIKGNKDYSSLFTVMVTNLSSSMVDEELFNEFKSKYGDDVLSSHIVYDLSRISTSIKKREEISTLLEMKRNEYLQHPNSRPKQKLTFFSNEIDSIDYYQRELLKLNEIIKMEKLKHHEGTGYGFVTFKSAEVAKLCIEENSPWKVFGFPICCEYEIENAPEFDDLFWENMSIGSIQRTVTSLVFNLLLLIFLSIIYLLTYSTSVYLYKKYQWNSWFLDFIESFQSTPKGMVKILFELLPVLVSIINEAVKPIIDLVSTYESHITRRTYSISNLKKTLTMMFFNYLVFPRLFAYFVGIWYAPYADAPFDNYLFFFNMNGVSLLQQLIALCTIAKGLELTFLFIGQMFKLFMYGYIERPKFDYAGNFAFRVVFLLLWLVYGSIQPLIFPFILLYFTATYILDKILIMYLYEKSEDSDGHMIKYIYENIHFYLMIVPFCVLLLTPSSFWMFKTWFLYLPCVFLIIYYLKWNQKQPLENVVIYGKRENEQMVDLSILVGKEEMLTMEEIETDFSKIASKYKHPYLELLK